jgi:hypothetical protein
MDDMEDLNFEYHTAIAERGAYLAFDCSGEEDYVEAQHFVHPRDTERIVALKYLIDVGYIDNLLLSHDVCLKTYTRTYGGYGYDHILRTIVPMLKKIGVTDVEMMVENPARAIDPGMIRTHPDSKSIKTSPSNKIEILFIHSRPRVSRFQLSAILGSSCLDNSLFVLILNCHGPRYVLHRSQLPQLRHRPLTSSLPQFMQVSSELMRIGLVILDYDGEGCGWSGPES